MILCVAHCALVLLSPLCAFKCSAQCATNVALESGTTRVPSLSFSPLCAFKCSALCTKCGSGEQNNQGALRRLLISDPKLPPTRPTICISSLLINYFLRPAICIFIDYFPQFASLAQAKYLSVATICSFSFPWKRSVFTK